MKTLVIVVVFLLSTILYSEESGTKKKEYAPPAFKGPDLIHMPTTGTIQKDILNFVFNHRFGNAKSTLYDFFGLDRGANTQISLDYGITDNFTIGLARYTAFKTYETRMKYALVKQSNQFPISISLFGGAGIETENQTVSFGPYIILPSSGNTTVDSYLKTKLNQHELSYKERTSYIASVLISRRFGEKFSLQMSPMIVHRNFVKSELSNNRLGLSLGGKFQLFKSVAIVF